MSGAVILQEAEYSVELVVIGFFHFETSQVGRKSKYFLIINDSRFALIV